MGKNTSDGVTLLHSLYFLNLKKRGLLLGITFFFQGTGDAGDSWVAVANKNILFYHAPRDNQSEYLNSDFAPTNNTR